MRSGSGGPALYAPYAAGWGGASGTCGKLGSGKTLLLLGLLGEADVLAGQLSCPRSPPDALAVFAREAEEVSGGMRFMRWER